LIRWSSEPESSAQTDPNPDATAMTGVRSRSDLVVLPVVVFTRMTRDCSLHAIHAESPENASVIVGQYGPAAAQILMACAPGRPPAALALPTTTSIASTVARRETLTMIIVAACAVVFATTFARFRPGGGRAFRPQRSR